MHYCKFFVLLEFIQSEGNRKYHSDMLKQNKLVRYKEANAPENPFVAAASASRKKAPSSSSTSETLLVSQVRVLYFARTLCQ